MIKTSHGRSSITAWPLATGRLIAASLLTTALAAQVAVAQSIAGKWEGTVTAQAQTIPVVITFDSAATGWSGTLVITALRPDPIVMSSVSVKKDTVSFQLPQEGMGAFIQGLLTPDRKTMNGMVSVQGDNSGTFQITKSAASSKPAATKPES